MSSVTVFWARSVKKHAYDTIFNKLWDQCNPAGAPLCSHLNELDRRRACRRSWCRCLAKLLSITPASLAPCTSTQPISQSKPIAESRNVPLASSPPRWFQSRVPPPSELQRRLRMPAQQQSSAGRAPRLQPMMDLMHCIGQCRTILRLSSPRAMTAVDAIVKACDEAVSWTEQRNRRALYLVRKGDAKRYRFPTYPAFRAASEPTDLSWPFAHKQD